MKASPEVVAKVRDALLTEGAGVGNSIHSWRCEYPDTYGDCDCVEETAQAVADAVAVLIAEQALEGLQSIIDHAKAEALRDAAEWFDEIAGKWLGRAGKGGSNRQRARFAVRGNKAAATLRCARSLRERADRIEAAS